MKLMEQCSIWNEKDEYQKIIDAIEALPEAEQTPELICELARAYNNVNTLEGPMDRELYQKAISLLESVEEEYQEDHSWNFRMAYAYYYLDQEGRALQYFEKALEARPGDQDTTEYIEDCRNRLALPRFEKVFRQRVKEGWASFLSDEARLRAMIDAKEDSEAIIHQATAMLAPAFADISFELGFNGSKHELILTPEGNRTKLFQLVYFQRNAPEEVLEHWDVLVGRQRSGGFHLQAFGAELSAADVKVWVEQTEENRNASQVSLALYCEKLLTMLQTEEEARAWWLLSTLLDQVMGEISAMELVDGFDVLSEPKQEAGILLSDVPDALKEMGLNLAGDAKRFLDNSYMAYELNPQEDPDADLRMDVFAGSSRCVALINEYLRGESDSMDEFHQNGIVPGFIYYPLSCFSEEENRGKAVLDFRDGLEAAILQGAGENAVVFTGGASGLYYGYLDFIAWDLPAVLNAAMDALQDSPIEWAAFHTYRRDVSGVTLMDKQDE